MIVFRTYEYFYPYLDTCTFPAKNDNFDYICDNAKNFGFNNN